MEKNKKERFNLLPHLEACKQRQKNHVILSNSEESLENYRDPSGFTLRMTKWYAFTLAEVLITMAIIGVVAALTIPTLVQSNQNRAWETGSKVFETKLEESLKLMNTNAVLSGYSTTEDFVAQLSKYMKISKTCTNDNLAECFPDKIMGTKSLVDVSDSSTWNNDSSETGSIDISTIKTASDLGQKKWSTNVMGLQLVNGQTALLAYNNVNCTENPYSNEITGKDCVAVVYDVTGFEKPNTYSKDLRTMNASVGDSGCLFKIGGVCATKVVPEGTGVSKAKCEELQNEGKVYACGYDTDYFAGAVEVCGGSTKIANMDQLTEIAKYVYNKSDLTTYANISGLNIDITKTAALGLGGKIPFKVWSNVIGGSNKDGKSYNNRDFNQTSTRSWGYATNTNDLKIICIE